MTDENYAPDIPVQQQHIHRCRDWPLIAEHHSNGMDDYGDEEIMSEEKIEAIFAYNIYKHDMNSSIDFVNSFHVPDNQKVKLVHKPGCTVCHHDYIPIVIHYLLLKGNCDVKTIQYFLFSKGLFYKASALRNHISHINVHYIQVDGETEQEKTINIINKQIQDVQDELHQARELGNVSSAQRSKLRNELRKFLELRHQLEQGETDDAQKTLSFQDLYNLVKTPPSNDNNNSDTE